MIKKFKVVQNTSVSLKSKQTSVSPVDITAVLTPFATQRASFFKHGNITWEISQKGNLNIKFGRNILFTLVKNLTVEEGAVYKFTLNQEKHSRLIEVLEGCESGDVVDAEIYALTPATIGIIKGAITAGEGKYNVEQVNILNNVVTSFEEFRKMIDSQDESELNSENKENEFGYNFSIKLEDE